MRIFSQLHLRWRLALCHVVFLVLCFLYAHILLFLSVVFTPFVALYTTNVRRFESSVGINPSRICCCCHDSYPYCPSALRRLFALKI